MRLTAIILLPLMALVLTAYGISVDPSPTTSNPKVRLGRFALGGRTTANPALLKGNETSAEIRARNLMRRKPTRRSTAQRRQTSDLPPEVNTVNARATSGGEPVGELGLGPQGPAVLASGGTVSALQYSASPSWTSRTDQQIEVLDPPSLLYPLKYLGWAFILYESGGGDRNGYLGPLEVGAAELTMSAVATPPGSTPQNVIHYRYNSYNAVETDLWTIDYLTSELSVVWTNPDGSQFPVYIVSNGARTFITGNPLLMHPSYGTGYSVIQMYYTPVI